LLSFVLSTLAFFAAAFWLKRYLSEQGINHGLTRNTLVVVLATAVSLFVSAGVDKLEGKPASDPQHDVTQLMKQLGR